MCGIAGILDPKATGDPGRVAQMMAGRLVHRGPDGGDAWADNEAGIGLGHRRLALVRDRVGIKPLDWSHDRGRLLFGSELKAGPLQETNFKLTHNRHAASLDSAFPFVLI